MGTTCACFKEHANDELVIINKEQCFILPNQHSELIVDFYPVTEQSNDTYSKNIIRLQGILRGHLDRKKVKSQLQDFHLVKTNQNVFSHSRDILQEIPGEFPYYPNAIVQSILQKIGEYPLGDTIDDESIIIRTSLIKLENDAVYLGS